MLALRQIPALLFQRRIIQQQRIVTDAELEHWLGPPVGVREMLREQRALAEIVGKRTADERG
jgi:hypothetical protein